MGRGPFFWTFEGAQLATDPVVRGVLIFGLVSQVFN